MHAFEIRRGRTPGQGSADLSGARRSSSQASNVPSHLADFLALQSSVGNQVMNQALAVQRASQGSSPDSGLAYGSLPGSSRSSSPDSGLAYGQPSGPSSPSFNGSIGGVHFSTDRHGDRMREIFDFVAGAVAHFPSQLAAAGSITVNFGRTQGGRPGEFRSESRRIVLDPRHAEARHGADSLAGTAVFEILNAAASHQIAEWEGHATNGDIEHWAAAEGITPAQYFARAMLGIEHGNVVAHQGIMAAAGRGGTSADRFAGVSSDFGTFYEQQGPGFLHSYEYRYAYLRAAAESASRRQTASSSQGGGSKSHGRRGHRSHR